MNILAVEVSTSSVKGMIYSCETGIISVLRIPLSRDVCDVATQDPYGVYKALKKCVVEIVLSNKCSIELLVICTTWHSILCLDSHRKPLGKIYTWANSEASKTTSKYRKNEMFTRWYYKRTGCMINCTYPFWQLVHIKETCPELFSKTSFLSSQQEFIFEMLTGEIAASLTTASGSGILNINTLDWDEELLSFVSLDRMHLSDLKPATYTGYLNENAAKELNLPANLPVVIGGPDGAMNQIGSGGIKEGIMTLSVGTSGAVRIACKKPPLTENPAIWCYYLMNEKRLIGAATSGAGNCVDWFVKKMYVGKLRFAELEQLLKNVDRKNAPVFLPFLYGERCPGWRDDRRGKYVELEGNHSVEDMYYSVLEGVLFNLYQCYNKMCSLNSDPGEIRVSGGITRSKAWLQMLADIFGRKIVICDFEHQSLLGAAIVAMKSTGQIKDMNEFEPKLGKIIFHNKNMHELFNYRYEKYLRYYEIL